MIAHKPSALVQASASDVSNFYSPSHDLGHGNFLDAQMVRLAVFERALLSAEISPSKYLDLQVGVERGGQEPTPALPLP